MTASTDASTASVEEGEGEDENEKLEEEIEVEEDVKRPPENASNDVLPVAAASSDTSFARTPPPDLLETRVALYSLVVGTKSPLNGLVSGLSRDHDHDDDTAHLSDPGDDDLEDDRDVHLQLVRQVAHQQRVELALQRDLRNQHIMVGMSFLFFVMSIGFLLFMMLTKGGEDPSSEMGDGTVTRKKESPSPSPLEMFFYRLPDDMRQRILPLDQSNNNNTSSSKSPQSQAYQWMLSQPHFDNDDQSEEDDWRIPQVYALATIFYALDGPHWPYNNYAQWTLWNPNGTRADWLQHELPFCGNSCKSPPRTPPPPNNNTSALLVPNQWRYVRESMQRDTRKRLDPSGLRVLDLVGLDLSSSSSSSLTEELLIPPEISLLFSTSGMKELKLGDHQGGFQNTSWARLLPWQQLGPLQSLVLSNTYASSSNDSVVPSELGLLTNLQSLFLNDNALIGTLPRELNQLSLLQELSIANNRLEGNLVSPFGILSETMVRVFNASHNAFRGPLPPDSSSLPAYLQVLDLSHNQLTGSLPSYNRESDNPSTRKLRFLSLSHNQFSGTISPALFVSGTSTENNIDIKNDNKSSRLKSLNLSHNSLTGSIPTELGLLSSATHIDWSHNRLNGSIPSELGRLATTITRIRKSRDGEWDPIMMENPRENQNEYQNEHQNYVSTTTMTGNLVALDLSMNALTGSIPLELSVLVEAGLRVLNLTGNPGLTGTIPAMLCQLKRPNCTHDRDEDFSKEQPPRCFLGFDCVAGGPLCGCEDCPCPSLNATNDLETMPPVTPGNHSNSTTLPTGGDDETNSLFDNLFSPSAEHQSP